MVIKWSLSQVNQTRALFYNSRTQLEVFQLSSIPPIHEFLLLYCSHLHFFSCLLLLQEGHQLSSISSEGQMLRRAASSTEEQQGVLRAVRGGFVFSLGFPLSQSISLSIFSTLSSVQWFFGKLWLSSVCFSVACEVCSRRFDRLSIFLAFFTLGKMVWVFNWLV